VLRAFVRLVGAVVETARIAVGADVDDADVARSTAAAATADAVAHFFYRAGLGRAMHQFGQIDPLHALAMNAHGMEFESRYEVGQCHHTV
jgi:hypothetical protein